jgi:hypothetical protein
MIAELRGKGWQMCWGMRTAARFLGTLHECSRSDQILNILFTSLYKLVKHALSYHALRLGKR